MNEILLTGFEKCFIGIVERFGQPDIACYDKHQVLAKLMADGMSLEEAEEYFQFNIIGGYFGEYTPCFLTDITIDDLKCDKGSL